VTADKRSVHTDALATLGTIIDDTQARDAIHLAVEPVIAGARLRAGDHVTLQDGVAVKANTNRGLGIVDPFVGGWVLEGERFWLVVYPRQITSLRHVWEHPSFPASGETKVAPADVKIHSRESERWLLAFADSKGVGYDEMLMHARDYVKYGEYWSEGGRFESESVPDEFWPHYEAVTGETVPESDRGTFFSCSC
jgi:hypothetical protein